MYLPISNRSHHPLFTFATFPPTATNDQKPLPVVYYCRHILCWYTILLSGSQLQLTDRIAHNNLHMMTKKANKRLKARQARAACLKSHVEQASKGQPTEALTNLKCSNITDKSIFVEGLQNAGLDVVSQPCGKGDDPNQVIIVLRS